MIKKAKYNCKKNKNINLYKADITKITLKKNNLTTSFLQCHLLSHRKDRLFLTRCLNL